MDLEFIGERLKKLGKLEGGEGASFLNFNNREPQKSTEMFRKNTWNCGRSFLNPFHCIRLEGCMSNFSFH